MKKQKVKKFFRRNFYIWFISIFLFWTVFWAYTSFLIDSQLATKKGSFDSIISFSWTTGREWYYVDDEDNSAIINNYFKWYYYDSLFWFFKLDWSSDKNENVKIIDSTDKCETGYWYKLWWKAYGDSAWYIDFNYNDSTFVYYCLDDWELLGTAYWKYIWFQGFDWIKISVVNSIEDLAQTVSHDIFINDTTKITEPTYNISEWWPTDWWTSIWWNIYQIDANKESIFYIVK